MSVANSLWLINIILAVLTLVMARNVLGTRGRRARDKRGHFLTEAVQILERSPKLDDIKEAWHVILRRTDEIDSGDTLVSAICALEKAEDVDVDALRSIIVRHVNLINQVGEFVDQGLVRPKDIARLHPRGHLNLLYQLALIAPFIWYESILQGRGRWGYRPLRLKTIFEQLRPISSRQAVRSPLVLEIAGLSS